MTFLFNKTLHSHKSGDKIVGSAEIAALSAKHIAQATVEKKSKII